MKVAEKQGTSIRTAVMLGAGGGHRLRQVTNGKPKCLVNLLGLTLLARNLRALKEVGILDVLLVVGCQGDAIEEAVGQLDCDGLNVRCLPTPDWRLGNGVSLMRAQAAASDRARFLVLMADHLFEVNTLRDFLLRVPDNGHAHMLVDFSPNVEVDKEDATYVRVSDDGEVCAIGKGLERDHGVDCGLFVFTPAIFSALETSFAAGDNSLTGGCRCLAEQHGLANVSLREGSWQDIDTPADYQNAKKRLLTSLAGPGDGLVARHINRKFSRPITAWLSRTAVTPNQVTIASFLMALAGAVLFAVREPLWAGLTVQLASIVDGVDGELARLKLRTSAFGTLLDSLLDRYADGLIVLAMGYYSYTLSPGWAPLLVTAAALVGVPLSMAFKDRYRIAFGCVYTAQADDGWSRYLLPNRDGRLFVAMLGGVSGFVLPALAFTAVVSHLSFYGDYCYCELRSSY